MSRKRYSPEEIINKLHEAAVLQSKGQTAAEVIRLTRVETGSAVDGAALACYKHRERSFA